MNHRTTRAGTPPVSWPLDPRINVVLFAGLGGACQGLEAAGCPVHLAVNHDAVAIAAHRALNPHTRHIRGDIFDVDPVAATGGRQVKILWASPDCRDHSVAKGGAPRSPRVRSMPWQICRWAAKTRPEIVFIENVREIRGWGPLVAKRDCATGRVLKADGTVAAPGERVPMQQQQLVRDRRNQGRHFRAFVRHLRGLGYDYRDRDLCCADFGVPTTRRRFFAVARRDGQPIDWMPVTHAPRTSEAVRSGALQPWARAADLIDWSLPLPSIFERPRPLAPATLRRTAEGMRRFVLEAAEPFLVHLTKFNQNSVGQSLDEPIHTLMAGAPRFGVVGPAVLLVCHSRDNTRGAHDGSGAQQPPIDIGGPLNTSTTKEDRCIVAASMIETGYGERAGQAPRALDIEQPVGTQVAEGAKHALLGAWMVQHNTGLTGHEAGEPVSALTTSGSQQQIAAAWMVQHNGDRVGLEAAEPVTTMTHRVTQQQVAAAYLVHQRGTGVPRDAREPAPALTTGGDRCGSHLVPTAAYLTEYYGTGGQHNDAAEPLNTLSTNDRFAITGAEIADTGLTPADLGRSRRVADFLRAHGVWNGGDIVTVTAAGQTWAIVDIGMRMLTPTEAARAHELRLPDTIEIDGKRRPLTKTESMRLIGNSVPPRMAQLLAQANVLHALEPAGAAQTGHRTAAGPAR